jgi:phage terminase small subunit
MGARGSGGHARVGAAKKGAEASLQDRTEDCTPPIAYWRYYAPLQVRRGLWTESSRDTMRSYCQLLVKRDRLEAALDNCEIYFGGKVNPLLAALRQGEQALHTLANDLALPPATAIRLPPRADAKQDDIDEWGGSKPRVKLKAVK